MQQNRTPNPADLAEMMHTAGVRPSVQRLAILRNIVDKRQHPTADEIFRDLHTEYPTMSRTTVYNSLRVLTDAGLLRELEVESGNRRYDFEPQPPHGHLRCSGCGRIFDMALPEGLQMPVAQGFHIDSVDIFFHGLCPACSNKEPDKTDK